MYLHTLYYITGQWYLANNELTKLSEEYLVDCDGKYIYRKLSSFLAFQDTVYVIVIVVLVCVCGDMYVCMCI